MSIARRRPFHAYNLVSGCITRVSCLRAGSGLINILRTLSTYTYAFLNKDTNNKEKINDVISLIRLRQQKNAAAIFN